MIETAVDYLKETVCQKDHCTGCMLCQDICGHGAIEIEDSLFSYNAYINADKCINCGVCQKLCPQNTYKDFDPPLLWQEGWCADPEERKKSSSGGVATAVAKAFAAKGGIVCSCMFEEGTFRFGFAYSPQECDQFRGSKYVKSAPKGVYRQIKRWITDEQKPVLFIGLPCQVAAVKQFVGKKDLLYCIDLICHGTPSPRILDSFLKDEGYRGVSAFTQMDFRSKDQFYLRQGEQHISQKPFQDRYTSCFLKCVDYTESCYHCKYAASQRISDLTLGDSWGSDLDPAELSRGVSLLLCQTEKGQELLHSANLYLKDADPQKAIAANQQLMHPSCKPAERDRLMRLLSEGKSFSCAFARAYPTQFAKQCIKVLLWRCGIKIKKD